MKDGRLASSSVTCTVASLPVWTISTDPAVPIWSDEPKRRRSSCSTAARSLSAMLFGDELRHVVKRAGVRPFWIAFGAPRQVDHPKGGVGAARSEQDVVTTSVARHRKQLAIGQDVAGWYFALQLGECVAS